MAERKKLKKASQHLRVFGISFSQVFLTWLKVINASSDIDLTSHQVSSSQFYPVGRAQRCDSPVVMVTSDSSSGLGGLQRGCLMT